MTNRRRLTGLLLAVTAATAVALAPAGPTHAGVRPPTCGTPNTPPCVTMCAEVAGVGHTTVAAPPTPIVGAPPIKPNML